MKLNWAERWAVNNPTRPIQQYLEVLWIMNRINLRPGARILEIGCGRGAGSCILKKAFHPSVLHSMDLDIRMIRMAGEYLSAKEIEGISFYVGDAASLPYPDETLDAVFGFGVLHHIEDWQAALDEIIRVLKKGGIYVFEELYPSLYQNALTRHILLHPTSNRFRSSDLKQAVQGSGLAMIDYLEVQKIGILGTAKKE
jgi:ubiquinone/menaquinone biosynthesis C-methylase UbiE